MGIQAIPILLQQMPVYVLVFFRVAGLGNLAGFNG